MRSGISDKLKHVPRMLAEPVLRCLFRVQGSADPWERSGLRWDVRFLGSSEYYRAYVLRKSAVAVGSIDEICEWLLGCEYYIDPEQCSGRDFWPPPRDFESSRRGDCKDHALWAWRKLNELGIASDLVCGQSRAEHEDFQPMSASTFSQGHAWVQFDCDGVEYLFDSAIKYPELMIRPLADCRACYLPWFAVGPDFRRYKYWGFMCSWLGLGLCVGLSA